MANVDLASIASQEQFTRIRYQNSSCSSYVLAPGMLLTWRVRASSITHHPLTRSRIAHDVIRVQSSRASRGRRRRARPKACSQSSGSLRVLLDGGARVCVCVRAYRCPSRNIVAAILYFVSEKNNLAVQMFRDCPWSRTTQGGGALDEARRFSTLDPDHYISKGSYRSDERV